MGRGQSDRNQSPKKLPHVLDDGSGSVPHSYPRLEDIQIADRLERLNGAANGGRGYSFVKDVIFALRKGDYDRAQAVYVYDRDKLELHGAELRDTADHLFGLKLT